MPFTLTKFSKLLKSAFSQLEKSQAEALSIEIAANFTAGMTAGEKHKSFNTADKKTAALNPAACSTADHHNAVKYTAASQGETAGATYTSIGQHNFEPSSSITSAEPEDLEDEGLTTEEKAEIAALTALSLGYLSGFNKIAQDQIINKAQDIIQAGGSEQEVKQYVDDVFEDDENIIIDNVGKTRKELYVNKDRKLSEVEKVITKKYTTSIGNYAQLVGDRASHTSYEAGRKSNLIKQGYEKWVFVGPADERARAWHVAILGEVYTHGTTQSEYAEKCLQEPRCRHRAEVFYGDSRDTPAETWQKLKDDAGLHWDEKEERWALKENVKIPKSPKTKVEKDNTKAPKAEPKKTPEEIKNIIKEQELKIKDRTTEKALIFDKNGNLVFEKEGIEDKVQFKGDEINFFKGNIVTHNHPGSEASLSKADIRQACLNGSQEIRAVSAKRIFSMKMKDGSDLTPEIWDNILSKEHEKIFNELIEEYRPKVQRGEIKIENATYLVSHFTWARVAKNVPEIEYKVLRW